MNRELEWNMCKLPDGVANSEIVDLGEKVGRYVSQALQYACRSWHKHLVDTIPPHIASVLHKFLEKKFLFWLEVLSVLGVAREAVDALDATAKCKWPDVCRSSAFRFRKLIPARPRHHRLSSSPETTFVSRPHSSRSSARRHHTYTTLHSPYPPKRRSFVRCTSNMPVP